MQNFHQLITKTLNNYLLALQLIFGCDRMYPTVVKILIVHWAKLGPLHLMKPWNLKILKKDQGALVSKILNCYHK